MTVAVCCSVLQWDMTHSESFITGHDSFKRETTQMRHKGLQVRRQSNVSNASDFEWDMTPSTRDMTHSSQTELKWLLQCVAVCCSETWLLQRGTWLIQVRQNSSDCCSVLQCVAVRHDSFNVGHDSFKSERTQVRHRSLQVRRKSCVSNTRDTRLESLPHKRHTFGDRRCESHTRLETDDERVTNERDTWLESL